MKLVIVAERSIGTPYLSVVSMIARIVLREPGMEVAIRASLDNVPASPVEGAMSEVARICDAILVQYTPQVGGKDSRANIYHRDYQLVTGADLVVAFFSEGSDMGGGTGHVVKAAIDRGVATMAYSVNLEGHVVPLLDGAIGEEGE